MPSQFFGLNIAYTGLLASNAALNTTSNNIANVQTEGYSRQQVSQQAYNALRVFQTYGCAGAGVETIAIERVRDEFYDGRYWENNAFLGEYNMKQYYMQQVETYFDDNGKNAGFKTVFNQFMITGIEELLKDPSSANAKAQFVGYGGALAEYFNGLAGNMEKLQKDVNQEIKLKVDEVNSLAGEIATLNKQINTVELAGQKANELRDRRALLLDQLSEIVDIETAEIPVQDTNNPDRVTGANRFIVKIASGQILVDDSEFRGLECVARTSYEKVNQTDIDGLYDVYWEDGQKFNLHNPAMGGALRGLAQMRDGNNSENFTGLVTGTGSVDLEDENGNPVSHDTVTVEVSQDYLQDLNKCNLSNQGGIINLGNQEFYYDSWSYTCSYDENGEATYSYTFVLSESPRNPRHITNDRVGKQAGIGTSIDYQGIPYYMGQMNEFLRTFSQKFNDILTSGYDSNNDPGAMMFTADHTTDDEQFDFPENEDGFRYDNFTFENYQAKVKERQKELIDEVTPTDRQAKIDALLPDITDQLVQDYLASWPDPSTTPTKADAEAAVKEQAQAEAEAQAQAQIEAEALETAKQEISASITVDVSDDSYYRMTAKDVSILVAMEKNPNILANKYSQGDGVEQSDLLKDLRTMVTDRDKMKFRNRSAAEFLECILSDVALNAARANTFQESYKNIAGAIDTQRISISGVDEDEEAVNLVKYQNGYNLASKMIQILTEIYDKLILETGV